MESTVSSLETGIIRPPSGGSLRLVCPHQEPLPVTCDTCGPERGLCSLGAGRAWKGIDPATSLGPLLFPGVSGRFLGGLRGHIGVGRPHVALMWAVGLNWVLCPSCSVPESHPSSTSS